MTSDRRARLTQRDAGLRRVSRLTRWLVAGSVAATGLVTEVAAHALPGRAGARRASGPLTASTGGATGTHRQRAHRAKPVHHHATHHASAAASAGSSAPAAAPTPQAPAQAPQPVQQAPQPVQQAPHTVQQAPPPPPPAATSGGS
jgi:type IV secretory pathway VirB10-like protein